MSWDMLQDILQAWSWIGQRKRPEPKPCKALLKYFGVHLILSQAPDGRQGTAGFLFLPTGSAFVLVPPFLTVLPVVSFGMGVLNLCPWTLETDSFSFHMDSELDCFESQKKCGAFAQHWDCENYSTTSRWTKMNFTLCTVGSLGTMVEWYVWKWHICQVEKEWSFNG